MHWRFVLLMMTFVALAHFNRISITVAGAEKIIKDGTISATHMGWVYSIFLVTYTICMVPAGYFIDRFGPRRAWLVVAFGSAAFVTVTGVVGWWVTDPGGLLVALLLVRAGFGVLCSPLHPTAARLVANWTPPTGRDFTNGAINSAACIGVAFTYVVFGHLMQELQSWPAAFMVTGGCTLWIAILWLVFGADHPPDAVRRTQSEAIQPAPVPRHDSHPGHLLADLSLVCLTVSYGLLGYFQYLFFYWAQYYFERELHLTVEQSRWASSQLTLSMGGGMILGGWLSDWSRRRYDNWWGLASVPMLGLLTAGTATYLGLFASDKVLCFGAAMAAGGICEGVHWTCAVRIGRQLGGTAAAIMNTGGNAIGLLAPALTPWISERFGWHASLYLAAIVCWVAAIAWLGIRLGPERESTS